MSKTYSKHKNRRKDGSINAVAPARSEIIGMLEQQGRPLQCREISAALKVKSDDSREILRRRLVAMLRDGELVKNRRNAYGLPAHMDLLKGRVSAHPDGFGFVIPDDRGSDLYLSSCEMRKVLHGDHVLAGVPGMATEIAIRSHGLPFEWPADVEVAAQAFGESVTAEMLAGRKDLRALPLVTIDGADARDFDDAVYARRQKNGWQLVVAIAEVSAYVIPGSVLDMEASHRSTSVYFPNWVIPMLPEALSNGLCSLKPGVDRLCLACEMTINANGNVSRSRFVAAVMNSSARLTYQQVAEYLESKTLPHHEQQRAVKRNLDDLHGLYLALRKARLKRGAIDFESTEYGFRFDQRGAVTGLVEQARNDAHKLIEECMILANVEAARFLLRHDLPSPYRVHAVPPEGKLEALTQFLRGQGIRVPWRDDPTPKDFAAVVELARGRADEHLIMAVILRSQSLAAYQLNNEGHFGLALKSYTHFTSPIRRYPDLLVHRAIHQLLRGQKAVQYPYTGELMAELCARCSHNSRRAEEAERDVIDRLKCAYLETRIGEEFEGMISGVTSFGLFVELDYGRINGLVHVTGLPNDYYHFDPVAHRMTGERTGQVFQLADRLKVRVVAVNLNERKTDFELINVNRP